MLGIENPLLFITTGVMLNLYPGPDNIYIMGRSISQGKKAGIVAALGISTGALFHTMLGAFGLSALIAASANAFFIIKLAGGLYLLWQGFLMLRQSFHMKKVNTDILPKTTLSTVYRQATLTNILNPKVALFFLAFLPQFIATDSTNKMLSFGALGLLFITTGTIICLIVAISSALISKKMRQNSSFSTWLLRINGCLFGALGIRLALSD